MTSFEEIVEMYLCPRCNKGNVVKNPNNTWECDRCDFKMADFRWSGIPYRKEVGIMTREKALWITYELWKWLSEDITRFKHKWPGWEKYGKMKNDCSLCQYNHENGWKHCNDRCILPIFAAAKGCANPKYMVPDPYRRWNSRAPAPIRAEAARQISRDALEEYKRLKAQKEGDHDVA